MSRTSLGRSLPTLLLTLLLVAGLGTGQALAQYGGEEEGQQATDQGMEGAAPVVGRRVSDQDLTRLDDDVPAA